MGGNQSKNIQRTDFTTDTAFNFVNDNSTKLNLTMDKNTNVSAESIIDGVTIEDVDNSNVKVISKSTAKFVSIEDINIVLETVLNSMMDNAVKLDAITGMMNTMKQESLGINNKQTNKSVSNTTFKLSTAVENINKMVTSICFCSKASVSASAKIKNAKIKRITNSDITVEAIAEAEASLTTLVGIMGNMYNESAIKQQMEMSVFNDLKNDQKQQSKAIEDLAKTVRSISDDISDVAKTGIETAGDVVTEGIGVFKWTIIGSIIGIIVIIALIIIFKLFKNNTPPVYYRESSSLSNAQPNMQPIQPIKPIQSNIRTTLNELVTPEIKQTLATGINKAVSTVTNVANDKLAKKLTSK